MKLIKPLLEILALPVLLTCFIACEKPAPQSAMPWWNKTTGRGVTYSQGASDTQVLIANSASISGPFVPYTIPLNAGIRAYLRMVNESGGIDGRYIHFNHHLDDEGDPVLGREALRVMVEEEKVFAIVGHFYSAVVAATVEDIKRYGIPAVDFVSSISELYATGAQTNAEGYNLFPVQPVFQTEGRSMVGYAAGVFKAETVGVIYTDDIAGENMFRGIIEQVTALPHLRVAARQVPTTGADASHAALSAAVRDLYPGRYSSEFGFR